LPIYAVSTANSDLREADAHYAVSRDQFQDQQHALREAKRRPASVRSLLIHPDSSAVALTFDDGHVSNAWAAQTLLDAGGTADFFVNTTTIGTPGYLSWQALREMADAGMSIQSHGHTHRYLDEVAPAEVDQELRTSKAILEDKLGRPVELFAPPGGRMPPDLPQTASSMGYKALCSSRVDLWHEGSHYDIPRLAVLRSTPISQFAKWLEQDRMELLKQRLRYGSLTSGKRVLGNANYERVRRALLHFASGGG
nr:polysaccharide deacetylase family protein [Pseudomonadota bacterium]